MASKNVPFIGSDGAGTSRSIPPSALPGAWMQVHVPRRAKMALKGQGIHI